MPAPPPFDAPLPTPADVEGWRGGLRGKPEWSKVCGGSYVYTSGLHHLLRSTDLPHAELLHMGAPRHLLRNTAPILTPLLEAADLLGRIVWDYNANQTGAVWSGDHGDCDMARDYGLDVIDAWFK